MKEIINVNQRTIAIVSSVAGLLFMVWYISDLYTTAIEIAIERKDIWYEMSTLIFVSPLFIPAFLGLFCFGKKNRRKNIWVGLSYLLYLAVLLFSFYWLNRPSDDALETGLPMVLFVLPICMALSVILLINVFNKKT